MAVSRQAGLGGQQDGPGSYGRPAAAGPHHGRIAGSDRAYCSGACAPSGSGLAKPHFSSAPQASLPEAPPEIFDPAPLAHATRSDVVVRAVTIWLRPQRLAS